MKRESRGEDSTRKQNLSLLLLLLMSLESGNSFSHALQSAVEYQQLLSLSVSLSVGPSSHFAFYEIHLWITFKSARWKRMPMTDFYIKGCAVAIPVGMYNSRIERVCVDFFLVQKTKCHPSLFFPRFFSTFWGY